MKKLDSAIANLNWIDSTELVGLVFKLIPQKDFTLFPQYTVGLHAWFLDQVRKYNPTLSASLHDEQSEKAFTISDLEGNFSAHNKQLQLIANQPYNWYVTFLSSQIVQWLGDWLVNLPPSIELRGVSLHIQSVEFFLPPTTYSKLLTLNQAKTISLTFTTPTSFRRKGYHFPLPLPTNLFHSYLRRWQDFSGNITDQEQFLEWVDDSVIIIRHKLETVKVAAGKKGSVTGFTGAIELSVTPDGLDQIEFLQLFWGLVNYAPYCGTGHKTTFGLGQTRIGWLTTLPTVESLCFENQLGKRIEELTTSLMKNQKRTGGERAVNVSQVRATILARRELGDSLQAIATDLQMPYETVKTYAKLARRALKS